jgi:FAD/FMN-containing dehydrogenase
MKIIKTGKRIWENRHETFTEDIADLYALGNAEGLDALSTYNDTTRAFMGLINEALKTQTPLRSLGAGWSWPKIATVNGGVMLDTRSLNASFDISSQSLKTNYTGDPANLLFAQCGVSIQELGALLKLKGKSLKTSGASNGQTIAGMIGSGAHGSAFDFGAATEFVIGIHIVLSPTRHVYLERASAPIVSATFIENIEAEHVLDDELFNAALVSFGSFGIIHGVMIETENLFLLEMYNQRLPYDESESGKILKGIMETLDFNNANLPGGAERPYHFAVLINPYDLQNGAYVTTMYKRDYHSNYSSPAKNMEGIGPGDDAPAFIGKLTNLLPAVIPTLVTELLGRSLLVSKNDVAGRPIKELGTLDETFSNTKLRGKLLSAAVGIPIEKVNEAIKLVLEANKEIGPFPGLFAFRFVKKSSATLGFTKFDYTCVMELDAAYSPGVYRYYTKIWQLLELNDIPFTFHWGKENELFPERIQRMYGPAADSWLLARERLLDPEVRKIFTNPLLEQWGLG